MKDQNMLNTYQVKLTPEQASILDMLLCEKADAISGVDEKGEDAILILRIALQNPFNGMDT